MKFLITKEDILAAVEESSLNRKVRQMLDNPAAVSIAHPPKRRIFLTLAPGGAFRNLPGTSARARAAGCS